MINLILGGQTSWGSVHEAAGGVGHAEVVSKKDHWVGRMCGCMGEKSNQVPSVLYLWCLTHTTKPPQLGLVENPGCTLCGKPASLELVLSSCQSSHANGKFIWRHDQILANWLQVWRRREGRLVITWGLRGLASSDLLKQGRALVGHQLAQEFLATAADWDMRADLRKQLKFPGEITTSTLRLDIVLWCRATKQAVFIELTVSWEERMEEARERKLVKYQALIQECQQVGWRAWTFSVEAGCREFTRQSLWSNLSRLEVRGAIRRRLVANISKQAETTSTWPN